MGVICHERRVMYHQSQEELPLFLLVATSLIRSWTPSILYTRTNI